MSKKSAVLELQEMARSDRTSVMELLRYAKTVASKLRLDDFEAWITHEKDGYPDPREVPRYRQIPTQLMAKEGGGYSPVPWRDQIYAKYFSETPLAHPINEIQRLIEKVKDSRLDGSLIPEEWAMLEADFPGIRRYNLVRRMSTASIAAILDAVRDRIHDWTLELEKQGVLGEGMTFTKEEQQIASSVTINNFGNLIHGNHGSIAHAENSPGANVTAATGAAQIHQRIRMFIDLAEKRDQDLSKALKQVADAINTSRDLTEEKKSDANEQLAYVAEQCSLPADRRPPPTVLKPVLKGLRETLGFSADVLQVWPIAGPVICAALGIVL